MSVDYIARLIYGYEITEEQYHRLEENYDIILEESKEIKCRVDTWTVCEDKYFFGVQTAHLDLNYNEYVEPEYASAEHANILNRIIDRLHIKLENTQYPRLILINGVSY